MASSSAILDPPVSTPPGTGGGGNGGVPGGGGGAGRGPGGPRPFADVAVLGMWVALAPILMLFLAFTSAYVVRHGLATDWTRVEIPRLLWLNTLVLLASSGALEKGRSVLRRGSAARSWTVLTLVLGTGFVVGQIVAWQQLRGGGVGIASSPYSSFFYLLTGAHGVHLAGGLLGLVAACMWPAAGYRGMSNTLALRLVAIYWHFMGFLWLGLFALLNFWR